MIFVELRPTLLHLLVIPIFSLVFLVGLNVQLATTDQLRVDITKTIFISLLASALSYMGVSWWAGIRKSKSITGYVPHVCQAILAILTNWKVLFVYFLVILGFFSLKLGEGYPLGPLFFGYLFIALPQSIIGRTDIVIGIIATVVFYLLFFISLFYVARKKTYHKYVSIIIFAILTYCLVSATLM